MTTVIAEKPTSLEEAADLITELCALLAACYDTVVQIDNELENGNEEEAVRIIDRFFALSETKEAPQLH